MKHPRKLLISLSMFATALLLANLTLTSHTERFHSQEERSAFHKLGFDEGFNAAMLDTMLPTGYNAIFAGSGVCRKCHGYDTLQHSSVNAAGEDVNVSDDWRSTMMANSAKDPFWRANVSHEILLHPQHKTAIETKCTSCHAPMGHFNAMHLGQQFYSIDSMLADPIAMDGVSCLSCHMQKAEGLGFAFSGDLHYDTMRSVWGPYVSPLVSPMLTETGYKPKYGPHVETGEMCAACHTLITETIDLQGNITENTFAEQATYHEWVNSLYRDSLSCQKCHMPSLDKYPVFLVTGAMTEARSPFFQHEFVGGNVTMLKLLQGNIEALDVRASAAQFDETIAKTMNMLQNKTLTLELNHLDWTNDTARFSLKLTNLAGHKFPSGYPSRRAFVEFLVKNEAGDTLFISGKQDENFEVFGQNATYEPHYQVISSEDEVQIYEMVMGDINGNVTTILERGHHPIKDNRLTPLGFSTSHPVYDTCQIAGDALNDPDFNYANDAEGSGTDIIYYHVPMFGITEKLFVSAKVWYQPTPPKWMKEMFDHSTPEIETFRTMFDAADRTPVLMKEAATEAEYVVGSNEPRRSTDFVKIYPVPSLDGRITVQSGQRHDLKIYDLKGTLVEVMYRKSGTYEVRLWVRGVYLMQFVGENGELFVRKVVVQ